MRRLIPAAVVAIAVVLTAGTADACWFGKWRACPRTNWSPQPFPAPTPVDLTTRVRVFLIADTSDLSLGQDMARELDQVATTLSDQIPKDRIRLDRLTGDSVSPEAIKSFVERWDVSPSEAVFCYVTSHGAYDPKLAATDRCNGHYFRFRHGGHLLQSELLAALNEKKARLTVLFGDSCNTRGAFVSRFAREITPSWLPLQLIHTDLELLLLGHTGTVTLNTAEVDRTALVYVFANSFGRLATTRVLSEAQTGSLWQPYLVRLNAENRAESAKQRPKEPYDMIVYHNDTRRAPAILAPVTVYDPSVVIREIVSRVK